MCFSTPKNTAADEASRAERERMAAIAAAQGQVNAVFNSPAREAEIERAVAGSRDLGTRELNRQKANTDRQLRFALARNGQIGGSTQIDQGRVFGEDYARALLGVEREAQGMGARIRGADQDARSRLITLATAGMDATTGASQAAEAMRVNLQAGASDRAAGSVADAFTSLSDFLKRSRDAADRRRADQIAGFSYYTPTTYGGGR